MGAQLDASGGSDGASAADGGASAGIDAYAGRAGPVGGGRLGSPSRMLADSLVDEPVRQTKFKKIAETAKKQVSIVNQSRGVCFAAVAAGTGAAAAPALPSLSLPRPLEPQSLPSFLAALSFGCLYMANSIP